jgi:hypothetical protein
MRSSTSSSDHPVRTARIGGKCQALLDVIALVLIGMELLSRFAYPRFSGAEQQFAREYRASVDTGRAVTTARQTIILGNSLLDAGLQFDQARQALLPDVDAKRLMFADTRYYDWYYGLRKLFADGARPDVIVLLLSSGQFVSSSSRGDYSAYHLMRTQDVIQAARDLTLSNTATSNLAFANVSAFFGVRAEARRGILHRIFPDLPDMMALITSYPAVVAPPGSVDQIALSRMQALRDLTCQFGARLVLVVPPTGAPQVGDPMLEELQNAGKLAEVPVLVPVECGSLTADFYSDNYFHLNRQGAEVFTRRFVESLQNVVHELSVKQ